MMQGQERVNSELRTYFTQNWAAKVWDYRYYRMFPDDPCGSVHKCICGTKDPAFELVLRFDREGTLKVVQHYKGKRLVMEQFYPEGATGTCSVGDYDKKIHASPGQGAGTAPPAHG